MFNGEEAYCAKCVNPDKLIIDNKPNADGQIKVIINDELVSAKVSTDDIYVEVISRAPTNEYMICYCHLILEDYEGKISPDRYHFYLVKETVLESSNETTIEILGHFTDPGDGSATWFTNGFKWYPEYGFVKMLVKHFDTWETRNKRLYFDRDLYERMKEELHGNHDEEDE